MTIEEIRENLRNFDCARCRHADWDRSLMAVNKRALDSYRRLGGRTVVDLGLAGSLFQAMTDGWTSRDVQDLIARLELIRSVSDPPKPSSA